MRTIKRKSIKLNIGKNNIFQSIVRAYAKEKQYWLLQFQQAIHIPYIKNHRTVRNHAVQSNYKSPYGLQARQWKLALQDAADTMDKYWQSLFDKIKSDIHKSSLTDIERHYAYWLLKDYARFAEVLLFKSPNFKELPVKKRKRVIHFLNRKIRIHKKQLPKVKKHISFVLDDNCYSVFEHHGRQYMDIMTLAPRKRIAVPLSGYTAIKGNVRIVLKGSVIEVHYASDIKNAPSCKNDSVIAIDFGYTEVMTDSDGKQYGTSFGAMMSDASDRLKNKMQSECFI